MDTLDYSVYSYNVEKVKISFKTFYSILDKIGLLLNEYLNLNFKPEKVSFRRIWYEYDQNGKPININKKIVSTQNWAFRGLYWLSKDLYEKDLNFLSSIEPDANEIARIRNYIEHKSFKVVEIGENKIVDKQMTFLIERKSFELKTIKLMQLVRAGIIYLSLGLNIEEQKKEINWPILPIDFVELDDKYKT
jgi:hypothetical protein